jgi:hypothetical protein
MNIRRLNRRQVESFFSLNVCSRAQLNFSPFKCNCFFVSLSKLLHYLNYRLICVVADGYSHRAKSNIKENSIHFEIGAGLTERARRPSYGLYSFSLPAETEFGTR